MRRSIAIYVLIGSIIFLYVAALSLKTGQAQGSPPNPEDMGPYAVLSGEDENGDETFKPPSLGKYVETRSVFYYPDNIAQLNELPLVVLLHGNHATCMSGPNPAFTWPCPIGYVPLPSYRGYDYVARQIASYGYIVVSVSANGVNYHTRNLPDGGASARAELLDWHLTLWERYDRYSWAKPNDPNIPYGFFNGKVNMQNVGMMGHSRGGEGIARLLSKGAVWPIRAVLPLAPTNFLRLRFNDTFLRPPALGVLLPYCDGDVTDLQGVHYFDDSRYNLVNDPSYKHTFLMLGANHNYFNINWSGGVPGPGTPTPIPGGGDDWGSVVNGSNDPQCGNAAGNGRLSQEQQRSVGQAYMSAFFRTYLGGEISLHPLLVGNQAPVAPATVFASYHAPNATTTPYTRKDLNRLANPTALVVNNLGGGVSSVALSPYGLCGDGASQHCLPPDPPPPTETALAFIQPRQPHTSGDQPGLGQLTLGWNASPQGLYRNQIPVGQGNVSLYEALQFRAGVNFGDGRNPTGANQNFSVALTDRNGVSASVQVSAAYAPRPQPLYYPPGSQAPGWRYPVPHEFLNTVRVPLSRFTTLRGDLDLTDVAYVDFKFDQTSGGALLVSDIAFANSLCPNPGFQTPVPCTNVNYRANQALATVTVVPGTTTVLKDCGDCTASVTLPFPYTFYDQTFTSVIVGDNGTLGFGPGSNTNPPNNTDLPSPAFNYAILPYWDDLYLFNGNGIDERGCGPGEECGIYTSTSGQAPNRIFNIEWRACQSNPNGAPNGQFPCGYEGTKRVIFEIRLHEGRKQFDLVYDPTANGFGTSIGAQRGTGTQYIQYLRNGQQLRPDLSQLTFTQQPCAASCPTRFQDVQSANTFNPFVSCLACRGIITGYGCGAAGEPCVCPTKNAYFRPNNVVTRGQASKMVAKSVGFNESISGQTFQDVLPSNTFYREIEQLARRGYVSGYPCGGPGEPCVGNRPYFRPYREVTRGQLAKIVSNTANFFESVSGQRFSDVPPGHVFYPFIQRLANRNVMTGYSDGTFRPFNNATRGQTSKIVANSFFPGCENAPLEPIPTPDGSPEGPEIPTPPPTMPAPIETQEPVLP